MARKAFFSFHYVPDNWRASQVRQMGALEGNQAVKDNDWETITKGGEAAIKKWIGEQMSGRSCAVVLIGANTAGRKWINYEIEKAWNDGKGVVGVHIHGLKNSGESQATKGGNPFEHVKVGGVLLSTRVKAHDTPYSSSTYVYDHIKANLDSWVADAIAIRAKY